MGYTDAIFYEILNEGPKSIFITPYRSTVLEESEVDNDIRDMLNEDLTECYKSGFNLPILIVKKKQKGIRICLDSRCLSKHIVKIRLPLPAINDLI